MEAEEFLSGKLIGVIPTTVFPTLSIVFFHRHHGAPSAFTLLSMISRTSAQTLEEKMAPSA